MDIDTSIVIFPGEQVHSHLNKSSTGKKTVLSRGLQPTDNEEVYANQAGLLKFRAPATYYVESKTKFYTPLVGDQIIGIIEDKGADFYRVNIFTGYSAILSRLGFEGATKRNKPELKRGDIVYARVLVANKHLDVEITCTVASGIKKDWSTGENIYGPLPNDGLVIQANSIDDARNLLSPNCTLLDALGKKFQYEIAIGVNGILWIKATSTTDTIAIRNAIINANQLSEDIQIEVMVEKLYQISKKMASLSTTTSSNNTNNNTNNNNNNNSSSNSKGTITK